MEDGNSFTSDLHIFSQQIADFYLYIYSIKLIFI